MPELPEVETIVKYLYPKVLGKKITGVEIKGKRVLRGDGETKEFKRRILGKKILTLARIGKNIIFRLSSREYLVVHLMMTGKLLWNPSTASKHDRLMIKLSGGNKMVFNDMRQFGKYRLTLSVKNLAGPDALEIPFVAFRESLKGRAGAIKPFLLNQKIISGIGNIYADEILWHAGVHPLRRRDTLNLSEIQRIFISCRKVLNLAIRKEGTSARDYVKPDGSEGGYYKIRKAYQRAGECCTRDGGIIKRIVIGQRSAYFCPEHQK